MFQELPRPVEVDVVSPAQDEGVQGWVAGLLELLFTPAPHRIVLGDQCGEQPRRHGQLARCGSSRGGCSQTAPEHIGQRLGAIATTTP